MEKQTIETIIRKFNEAGICYLLDLDPKNALKALEVLKSEGYAPKIPVPIEQFADAELRTDWVENRNMVAFPLWSEQHRMTGIDLFVNDPFDFARAFNDRFQTELSPGLIANFVSYEDLLALKREANRPKDLQDIYHLQSIKRP